MEVLTNDGEKRFGVYAYYLKFVSTISYQDTFGKLKEAYGKGPVLSNLLLDPYFKRTVEKLVPAWHKVAVPGYSRYRRRLPFENTLPYESAPCLQISKQGACVLVQEIHICAAMEPFLRLTLQAQRKF